MLNPYFLLGLLLFWGASITGAYFKGSSVAQNAARAHYASELEASIVQHNANAVIDMQAAAKVASDQAVARTRTAMLRSQANEVVRASPMPNTCNLDAGRMQLIAESVNAANGENAAGRVRDAAKSVNSTIR